MSDRVDDIDSTYCLHIQGLMAAVLEGKVDPGARVQVKTHLDTCRDCWAAWNVARWRVAESSAEFSELRLYLGEDFVYGLDSSWLLVDEWNGAERTSAHAIETFYQETQWYLYNQVIFSGSGQRSNYVDVGLAAIKELGITSILDFGCGVGSDGVRFAEEGLEVGFYDLNSACLGFLSWRLEERGLKARVFDPSDRPTGYEALWLMDVVEHLFEPGPTLARYLESAKVLFIDTDSDSTDGGRHPFHFPESMAAAASFLKGNGYEVQMRGRLQIWSRSA